jgi:predicted DCC family thiol-disulfide oxidoreductase YuxK
MKNSDFPLTLLYDGNCPVCTLEMHALRDRALTLNPTEPALRIVDIALPGFDARPYGATLADMNALIHAQRPDGSLVIGVEVFRLAYGAVGLGHWVAPTGWPWLKPIANWAYAVFARNRYGISRLMAPVVRWVLHVRAERAAKRALAHSQACQHGACELNHERSRS